MIWYIDPNVYVAPAPVIQEEEIKKVQATETRGFDEFLREKEEGSRLERELVERQTKKIVDRRRPHEALPTSPVPLRWVSSDDVQQPASS